MLEKLRFMKVCILFCVLLESLSLIFYNVDPISVETSLAGNLPIIIATIAQSALFLYLRACIGTEQLSTMSGQRLVVRIVDAHGQRLIHHLAPARWRLQRATVI